MARLSILGVIVVVGCGGSDDPDRDAAVLDDAGRDAAVDGGEPDSDAGADGGGTDGGGPDAGGPDECEERGLAACGGSCVRLESDERHCGGCDQACGDGIACVAGGCVEGECDLECP